MNTEQKRLHKLAVHLDSDEPLYVGRFDFREFGGIGSNKLCGCAIGETSFLFDGWRSGDFGSCLVFENNEYTGDSVREFYDLNYEEYLHLFFSNEQDEEQFGGRLLGDNATRKQVAENIFAFLSLKEQGESV